MIVAKDLVVIVAKNIVQLEIAEPDPSAGGEAAPVVTQAQAGLQGGKGIFLGTLLTH